MIKDYIKNIASATGEIQSDLVIKNGKIIDVFNLQIIEGDVAISNGIIVGIGGNYEGLAIIDAKGRYISPSFIDSHVHIESSMTTPSQFAEIVLPHGVTTIITDPHEIANVGGEDALQFMLDESDRLPLDILFMLPSCVPATPFESSGAILHAKHLKPFYQHPRVIGLAEVMDAPSVQNRTPQMIAKLQDALQLGMTIDGHGAGLDEMGLNAYGTANILTDHECTTQEEALNRISRGMYVQIREGSAAKDLKELIPCVTARNSSRFLLCTDDKHLSELIDSGSIDQSIRLAIEFGCDPLIAIQMASINATTCYGIKNTGAIAPGYKADFLLLDDLESVQIFEVYKKGKLVAKNGNYLGPHRDTISVPSKLLESVHLTQIELNDFQIPLQHQRANLIELIPNSLLTHHLIDDVNVQDGNFVPCTKKDHLKLAVVERHLKTGNIGLGIVKGFGLKEGAIASTIAHDSHNLMVVGTNDVDMFIAVKVLEDMQGGIVVIRNGEVLAALPLPIGGLMSAAPISDIQSNLKKIETSLEQLGFDGSFDFLITLAFLSLPVIPEIKITHQGLFDVKNFKTISVQNSKNIL